jgi:hypothetical protein
MGTLEEKPQDLESASLEGIQIIDRFDAKREERCGFSETANTNL